MEDSLVKQAVSTEAPSCSSDSTAARASADVMRFVRERVGKLQSMVLSERYHAAGARDLAVLRRAVTTVPGAAPEVWGIEFEGMPDSLAGVRRDPSAGEWAVHAALTLYAVHQQSQQVGMHCIGEAYGLGASVRQMVWKEKDRYKNLEEGQLPRRFAAMVTSETMEEMLHYARQIVQLLRSSGIPLDYGLLARDLFEIQNPYRSDFVRLTWGRGYTHPPMIEDEEAEVFPAKSKDQAS
jgi:CRISPR system Cascade subunit CasB